MARAVKVISQIDEHNSSLVKFFLVIGNEVRQIGLVEYAVGTSFNDGVEANTKISEVLQKCYTKRIKEMS